MFLTCIRCNLANSMVSEFGGTCQHDEPDDCIHFLRHELDKAQATIKRLEAQLNTIRARREVGGGCVNEITGGGDE